LSKFTDLRIACVVGGDSIADQFAALATNPDMYVFGQSCRECLTCLLLLLWWWWCAISIIATPGRLLHHISEVGNFLKAVEYLVFDEADRLFEMGLQEQLLQLLTYVPSSRQTLLFSATLPPRVVEFSQAGLNNPAIIRLDSETKLPPTLKIQFFLCRLEEKEAALVYMLNNLIKSNEQTIIFTATR
jgi:ATP-dependent RNA helicase DDX54/DBP10